LKTLQDGLPKEKEFTIIYCGSLRRMKRSMEALRAFLIFIRSNPQAKLWFVGGGNPLERAKLEEVVRQYTLEKSVTFFGTVSEQEKANLLQRAHVLTVTSVKEGWGLVVTEAGMCGTPAVVYNVDGLRDSCLDGVTGLVVPNNSPQALSQAWQKLYDRPDLYHRLRRNALRWNSQYTAEGCYEIFSQAIGLGR
jgi:glycosyltransferase involved in cell wall biosynthesis